MQRLQKSILGAVVLSEMMHIFCCVLPILFSVFSLIAGLGVIGAMPQIFTDMHEMIHGYEKPMIITSGIILVLGWILYSISRRLDCHDTGCAHGSCEPKKDKAHTILKVATVLFVINVSIYMTLHRSYDKEHMAHRDAPAIHGEHQGHDHHKHEHHH